MTIYRGPGGTGSATSDADTTLYQDFLNQTIAARDAALQAETNAELAETNAETAEANAETAEANAAASASAAASSASSASTSATNAASSASAASTSASNAASSASNASSSASAASTSATNAASSATAAASSASAAATSETNAASSASAAATSATNAANSASSASTSASNAANSATSASNSASSAATSATNAANSATSASNSATAAAASASEAAGYAASINPADLVHISGTETITGAKTFSQTVTGSITGNAGTVTNGVYTTGDQTIAGTKTLSSNPILSGGTANGVAYLNGSKVLTSGSALTFDGTNLATTGSVTSGGASNSGNLTFTGTGNRITGDFSNATIANRVMFQTSTVNGNTTVSSIPNGTAQVGVFRAFNNSDPTNASYIQLAAQSGFTQISADITGTGTYLPMTFYTNGSERMRLDTSGNLGIGTSSPGARLRVIGAASTTAARLEGASGANITVDYAGVGDNYFDAGNNIFRSAAGTERARIDSSGNVGIGTTSPIAKLESSGNIGFGTGGSFGAGQLYSDANWGVILRAKQVSPAHAEFAFQNAGGTERMRIDSSGNLSIGSAGVASPTTVGQYTSGNNAIRYAWYQAGIAEMWIGQKANVGALCFGSGGGTSVELMRLDTSGNLLVGTTSVPANAGSGAGWITGAFNGALRSRTGTGTYSANGFSFYWNGNAQLWVDSTNVGNISISSDYRIKQKIETQNKPAIDRVMQLRPVTYELQDYGDLFKADGISREGFIAHELQEVVPSAVEGEKDAPNQIQSLKLDALCSVMVKAIQEQQAIINAQQAALEQLKARLDAANL